MKEQSNNYRKAIHQLIQEVYTYRGDDQFPRIHVQFLWERCLCLGLRHE